jgi:hypothetical protein
MFRNISNDIGKAKEIMSAKTLDERRMHRPATPKAA